MESGELQSKLQELKTLHELGLLTLDQVQRTTDELLKAFATPNKFKLLHTSTSVNESGLHHNPSPIADQPAAAGLSGTAERDTPDSGTLGALAEAMSLPRPDSHRDEGTSHPIAIRPVQPHPQLPPHHANRQASFDPLELEQSMNEGTSTPSGVPILPHQLPSTHLDPAALHSRGLDLPIKYEAASVALQEPHEGASETQHLPNDEGEFEEYEEEWEDMDVKDTVETEDLVVHESHSAATAGGQMSHVRRNNWRFLTCRDSRDEVEQYLSETGLQFAWHRGGGKKGGYTKLCKSHKNCEYIVRVSLVRSGWMVCCRGNHAETVSDRYRGILPKYVQEIDAGCQAKKMPKQILKQLRMKYGMSADLPTAKQIDNRKRTLMTREGLIPRRISPKKLKALQAEAEAQAQAQAQAQAPAAAHPPMQLQPQPQRKASSPEAQPSPTHDPAVSPDPSAAIGSTMLPTGIPAVGHSANSHGGEFNWDQILPHDWRKPSAAASAMIVKQRSPSPQPAPEHLRHQDSISPAVTCSRSTANAVSTPWPGQGLGALIFHP